MQLEWIDDILAVLDSGSLARAAERRFLTQSAFTRRIRAIEDQMGVSLFDRSRKPVAVRPGVQDMEPELRTLARRLRRLQQDLKRAVEQGGRGVTLVFQHALTTTFSPQIVRLLTLAQDKPVCINSANRDRCLLSVLSGHSDFAIIYDCGRNVPRGFETCVMGRDLFVPVAAPTVSCYGAVIPTISYPPDVFFGRVFDQSILPFLPEGTELVPQAETALTLAACAYALQGIGVAWLPLALVEDHLSTGQLVRVEQLPAQELGILLTRLRDQQDDDALWNNLVATAELS